MTKRGRASGAYTSENRRPDASRRIPSLSLSGNAPSERLGERFERFQCFESSFPDGVMDLADDSDHYGLGTYISMPTFRLLRRKC